MKRPLRSTFLILHALLIALLVAACGGGNSPAATSGPITSPSPSPVPGEPEAPASVGNTAIDGANWFNYRRQQMGVQKVVSNANLNTAAQGHSDYQKINGLLTHEQTPGRLGFTGVMQFDRMQAANYSFTRGAYAYGEVLSSSGSTSGMQAAEDLIAAIYHRYIVFEPMFKEIGTGGATVAGGATYFTANFATNGLDQGLGDGKLVHYPFANQQNVPVNFFSDQEAPDPVPGQNEVGYPVSVHADIVSAISVQSFTIQPRGGAQLATRLLQHANDSQTPASAAALIPLQVLTRTTTYDVQFTGAIDGIPVSRSWSFTTR